MPLQSCYCMHAGMFIKAIAFVFLVLVFCVRYLKWSLGGNIGLVARCEYDAVMATGTGQSFINIKALNEWDSKVS